MPIENTLSDITSIAGETKFRVVTAGTDGESKVLKFETLEAALSGSAASANQTFSANNFIINSEAGAVVLENHEGIMLPMVRSSPDLGGAQLGGIDHNSCISTASGVRLWTPTTTDDYADVELYAGDSSSVNFAEGTTEWTETTISADMSVESITLNVLSMPDGAAKIRIAYEVVVNGSSIGACAQTCTAGEYTNDLGQELSVGENTLELEVPVIVEKDTIIRPVYYLDKQVNFEGTVDSDRIALALSVKYVSRNELVFTNADGNTGFGTDEPTQKIEIAGTGYPALLVRGTDAGSIMLQDEEADADEKTMVLRAEDGKTFFFSLDDALTGAQASNIICMKHSDGYVGINHDDPLVPLDVKGTSGPPSTTGTDQAGIFGIRGDNNSKMNMGQIAGDPHSYWIQVQDRTTLGTNYPLLLQPNGGCVSVGTLTPDYSTVFQISNSTKMVFQALDRVTDTLLINSIASNADFASAGYGAYTISLGVSGTMLYLYWVDDTGQARAWTTAGTAI